LLGGRESLPARLHSFNHITVKTTCGSGLVLGARSNIKVSGIDRLAGFIKSKVPIHTGRRALREMKHEYNELRRRTLTCVCLTNSNLNGAVPLTTPFIDQLIGDEITLQEVGRRLDQGFHDQRVEQLQQRQQQRQEAVGGLMRDLLIE
jgi:hypothetical protein